jgi:hypothetical protein
MLGRPPHCSMSDQIFYLQLNFIPKIGHTFNDEREVVVEVPKDLVQRKSESISESLKEVIALGLRKVRLSAHSRTRQNDLSICTMKILQFGIRTGLPS